MPEHSPCEDSLDGDTSSDTNTKVTAINKHTPNQADKIFVIFYVMRIYIYIYIYINHTYIRVSLTDVYSILFNR